MLEKLSQEQQEKFKSISEIADKSYSVVFEGMRSFAEKLEETDPNKTDAHLLAVLKATANLMEQAGTPGFVSLAKDVLASLQEYENFLEKYHADQGGVSYEGRDITDDFVEMMPDSLHAALDEYSQQAGSNVKMASDISKTLRKKYSN